MKEISKIILLTAFIGGCSSMIAETPGQRIYALRADFIGLLPAAIAYKNLPDCAIAEIKPCSDINTVIAIQEAARDADTLLDQAEIVVRDPSSQRSKTSAAINSAAAALAALTKILSDRGVL